MLFGFGDCENPRQDTIELVEELVVEYLTDITTQAARLSTTPSGTLPVQSVLPRIRTDDLLHVLRHDDKKLARVEELLFMNEELKRARKAFDIEEEGNA